MSLEHDLDACAALFVLLTPHAILSARLRLEVELYVQSCPQSIVIPVTCQQPTQTSLFHFHGWMSLLQFGTSLTSLNPLVAATTTTTTPTAEMNAVPPSSCESTASSPVVPLWASNAESLIFVPRVLSHITRSGTAETTAENLSTYLAITPHRDSNLFDQQLLSPYNAVSLQVPSHPTLMTSPPSTSRSIKANASRRRSEPLVDVPSVAGRTSRGLVETASRTLFPHRHRPSESETSRQYHAKAIM